MPGETLVIKKGQIVQRIIREALPAGPPQKLSLKDSLSSLEQALDRSVEIHLRSDVPYGVLLSGNIESSCLVKLMTRHTKDPIKTFSITLPDANGDREKILSLSKTLCTEHQEISFDETDFWTLLPQIMAVLDDPTLDTFALPTYKMAEIASKSVKVLLSGEGGDELFGSERYESALKPWWLGGSSFSKDDKLKKFGFMRYKNDGIWKERDALLVDLEKRNLTRLQTAQAIDIGSFLPNDLLLKLDRCLMAHGVEGRTPFLDKGVVDASFNLPDHLKFKDRVPQGILREWLTQNSPEVLPFLIQNQPTLPIGEWIRTKGKELGPLVAHQKGVAMLCRGDQVEKLFQSTQKEAQHFAWGLLCFALWHQIHILGIPPQEDVITTLIGPQPDSEPEF